MSREPSRAGDDHRTDRAPVGVRLLEADPELGAGLSARELAQARRHVVLPAVALDPGPWDLAELGASAGVRGDVLGFLLLEGTVTINVQISRRSCVRLLTAGELVLLDEQETDSMPLTWGWSILEPARLAILDGRLQVVARRWPALLMSILQRGAQQTRHALLQQAIGQLPRVEQRLLALLWSIADRQGVVRGDGVWVHLPATQETLAQMIGARRPTVSLGLKRLTEEGLISTREGGWLLHPDSLAEFRDAAPARESLAASEVDLGVAPTRARESA